MGEAIQAVKAASQGIDAITKLIEQAKGLISQARSATTADRLTLAGQFDDLMTQIDELARDAGYKGTNFLDSGTLIVDFNEDGTSSLTITGFDASSTRPGSRRGRERLGGRRGHHRRGGRHHGGPGHAASAVHGDVVELRHGHHPHGVHDEPDQHAAAGRDEPDRRRTERGRRQHAGSADVRQQLGVVGAAASPRRSSRASCGCSSSRKRSLIPRVGGAAKARRPAGVGSTTTPATTPVPLRPRTAMALRLTLSPTSAVILGGAVIRNGPESRSELRSRTRSPCCASPTSCRPSAVHTPCERIYLAHPAHVRGPRERSRQHW